MLRTHSLATLMLFGCCAMLTFAQSSPTKSAGILPGPRLDVDAEGLKVSRIGPGPITLSITEDTKTIYEMVCKGAGIDVYFHPEVNSRRIHVELNGVTLGEALTAIAVESKTVWRPLTSSTISVQNSPEREKREPSPAVRFVPISPA